MDFQLAPLNGVEKARASLSATQVNKRLELKQQETKASLGQQDFLALLTTQMRYQDPLSPMDNKEWVSQMANFSGLQARLKANERLDELGQGLKNLAALNLIGKHVVLDGSASHGSVKSGLVENIKLENTGQVSLQVEGSHYPMSQVQSVYNRQPQAMSAQAKDVVG